MSKDKTSRGISKHPVLINILIIIIVAFLGLWIVHISTALFTKHGEEQIVPKVENMSYTKAIELLHSYGLNVDIRDSLFRDDVKPGFVIEQFPKANSVVKPGRKIFLYINAVHPKEVIIDDNHDRAQLALKGLSIRQAMSRLQELGFKEIERMEVLGVDDRVVKVLANGKPVHQMQKVPVNAKIVVEVSDGRLQAVRDSLFDLERIGDFIYDDYEEVIESAPASSNSSSSSAKKSSSSQTTTSSPSTSSAPTYFEMPDEEPSSSSGGGGNGGGEVEQSTEFF